MLSSFHSKLAAQDAQRRQKPSENSNFYGVFRAVHGHDNIPLKPTPVLNQDTANPSSDDSGLPEASNDHDVTVPSVNKFSVDQVLRGNSPQVYNYGYEEGQLDSKDYLSAATHHPEVDNKAISLSQDVRGKNYPEIGAGQSDVKVKEVLKLPFAENITRNSTAGVTTIGPFSVGTQIRQNENLDAVGLVSNESIGATDDYSSVDETTRIDRVTDTVMPFNPNDYFMNNGSTEASAQKTKETTDSTESVVTAEDFLSSIEETTSDVQNSETTSTTIFPITEVTTIMVILEEGETSVGDLFPEETTETAVPAVEESFYSAVPVTEELISVAAGMEENTDSTAPFTKEYTTSTIPTTDVSEEKYFVTLPRETSGTLVHIADEATRVIFPDSGETTEITTPPAIEYNATPTNAETVTMVSDENEDLTEITEVAVPSTEEIPADRIVGEHFKNYSAEKTAGANSTKPDVILEASPRLDISHEIAEGPLEPTSFDVQIKTIKDLQVDVHDAIFDPSQIAKATSYEESSYSTATRSATVTTWVDPNNRNFVSQVYGNLTNLKEVVLSPKHNPLSSVDSTKVLPSHKNEPVNKGVVGAGGGGRLPVTAISEVTEEPSSNVGHPETTVMKTGVGYQEKDRESETGLHSSETLTLLKLNPESPEDVSHQIPVFRLNVGEYETVNGTRVYVTNSNKTETQFIYEMPDLNRSSGTHLTPSVVIALSICCSVVVLISILTVLLWFCRRHKNRSKIYLSRDAARPRAFFTKPMNPALLPNERPEITDSGCVMDFQKPRAPVVLSDDPEYVIIDGNTVLKTETEGSVGGTDNQGFIDIPLDELSLKKCPKDNKNNPPKIGLPCQYESDADSGIRVWSSTGSLYTVTPDLSHCSAPPPPYTSSIDKESVNLSVDPFVTLGSKSRLLYV